nr:winged helix DNA-binding protein [Limosilactobacillus mucosae]
MNEIEELQKTVREFDRHAELLRHQMLDKIIAGEIGKFSSEQARRLTKHHFSHSEMQLLSYIENAGAETAYQQLTQDLEISQGMISRYVKRLAELGLLDRYHKPDDKKAIYLRITSVGSKVAKLHKMMHEAEYNHYAEIMAELPAESIKNTIAVLKRLTH